MEEIIKGVKRFHSVHKKWVLSNGEVLEGDFEFKLLTVKDRAKIPVLAKNIMQELGVNSSEISHISIDLTNINVGNLELNSYYLSVILATLELTLVKKPDWFDLNSIVDENILVDLATEYTNFENFFRIKPLQS